MATQEHTTPMATQLVRFHTLLGSQQSIDLGERLGSDGRFLADQAAGGCGELIDVGIRLAGFNGIMQGQPVLFELLRDGPRGLARRLHDRTGLFFLSVGQV